MTTAATKSRPIRQYDWEVRAILDGRMTQARRVVDRVAGHGRVTQFHPSTTPGYDWQFRCRRGLWQDYRSRDLLSLCPYGQPGDELWVRETWAPSPFSVDAVVHKAGFEAVDAVSKWKPSIHMPRWASRITLTVKAVRVERLQDITEGDAVKEGMPLDLPEFHLGSARRRWFVDLWRSINGPDSWDANPWVWVLEFERKQS